VNAETRRGAVPLTAIEQAPRCPVFVGKLKPLQTRVNVRLAGGAGAAPPK
jgi:hypothetical protein